MKVGKRYSGVLFSNLVPEKVAAFQFKSNLRIIGINSRIKNDAFSYGGILGSREASYSYVGFAFPGIFIKQSSLAHFEENLAVGLKLRELSYRMLVSLESVPVNPLLRFMAKFPKIQV